MRREPGLRPRDGLYAVMIFVVALALRVPFRSHLAYWWDCAQSAVAIEQYNVLYSQPQVPGYFLYVLAGRAANHFTGDPLRSLIWISVVAGAGLTSLGYCLGTAMFDQRCGCMTGVILGTGLLTWFQSCIGLMHIVDGALVCAFVCACWWAVQRDQGWRSVILLAVLLAVLAGVRQQSAVMLLPLWLYGMSRMRPPRLPKLIAAVVLFGALCLLWFVPMVISCGGLGHYFEALAAFRREFGKLTVCGGGGWRALGRNLDFIVASCWVNLLAGGVLAVAGAAQWLWLTPPDSRRQWYARHQPQLRILGWWVVPMLVFWLGMRVLWPGYVLGYLPAVVVVAALCISRRAPVMKAVLVGIVNMAMFINPPRWAEGLLHGLPLTARELREHDRQLERWFRAIREQFRPDEVLVCHREESLRWGFRHFQYHLPDYVSVMLTPDRTLTAPYSHQLWYGLHRQTEFAESFELRHRRKLLLVVPPGESLNMFAEHFDLTHAQPVTGGDGGLFVVAATTAAAANPGQTP